MSGRGSFIVLLVVTLVAVALFIEAHGPFAQNSVLYLSQLAGTAHKPFSRSTNQQPHRTRAWDSTMVHRLTSVSMRFRASPIEGQAWPSSGLQGPEREAVGRQPFYWSVQGQPFLSCLRALGGIWCGPEMCVVPAHADNLVVSLLSPCLFRDALAVEAGSQRSPPRIQDFYPFQPLNLCPPPLQAMTPT